MKFTQFEVVSEPGKKRAGMAFEGRFYETEGTQPVAVHEAMDVRLLAPINRPGSVRFFPPDSLDFVYANPHVMFGPSEALKLRLELENIFVVPGLAVVIGGQGGGVTPRDADDLILGVTLVNSFRTSESGPAGFDLGFSVGPIITTPDEFDDSVTVDAKGRRHRSAVTLRLNSVETETISLADLPFTPAEAIAHASRSCVVYPGDLLVIELSAPVSLERGDEFATLTDKVGTLTNRLV